MKMLGIWPALPIVIRVDTLSAESSSSSSLMKGANNIVAALEYSDRICEISLHGVSKWLLERFAAIEGWAVLPPE